MQYSSFIVNDSGAIFNRKLDRGETVDLILLLRNAGSRVGSFCGQLQTDDPYIDIIDNIGTFDSAGPGETTLSRWDWFRIRARSDVPVETKLRCELVISGSQYQDTIEIPLIAGDSMNLPVGPDNYGYMVYDWTDSCYEQIPRFQWKEVRGIGQRVVIGDDETAWFELPSSFGFWRYYSIPYRFISICSNGWIAADTTRRCDFTNVQLPYTGAPPNIVAFLWDDLAPTRYGYIWYYFDTTQSRIIVEFDSIPYFGSPDKWETVQIQIYDTSYLGANHNNPIGLFFRTVNDYTSVTVGLQNQDGTSGLTYYWNGNYPRTAATLSPLHALWVQSDVCISVEESCSRSSAFTSSGTSIVSRKRGVHLGDLPNGVRSVEIFGLDGRQVWRSIVPFFSRREIFWDGTDLNYHKVESGVYYLLVRSSNGVFRRKLILLSEN
ncbi:MAG: hypothetical protein ABIJ93_05340 [candidate division WOR-3 bacterium]